MLVRWKCVCVCVWGGYEVEGEGVRRGREELREDVCLCAREG